MAFDNIISVYLYGSMVYGTANAGSDYDFIAIVKDKHDLRLNNEVVKIAKECLGIEMKKSIQADVHAYTEEEFLTALNGMEISFLECVNGKSANFEKTLVYGKEYPMPKINLALLRESLSRKASNSWVKSKKKLQPLSPDYSPKIGKKSAWHALRIIMYGIQLATVGKIENIVCANGIYQSIMQCGEWADIDMQFRQTFNSLSSEFRKVAPK